jgi:Ca2+-binding RTX toxin-like protein
MCHLGHDGSKVNGIRLGEYIALDRGNNHVLKFTDSYGGNAESISLPRSGLLDINIQETSTLDLIQGTDAPDVIVGSLAADKIAGGAGNDVILASQGMDILTGNTGSDVYFFDPSVYSNLSAHQDRILDFEFGKAGDKLDVYELLKLSGYNGTNAIADGYISIKPLSENSLELQFDSDGPVGVQSPSSLAILENVDPQRFQNEATNYLIVTETEF